MSEPKQSEGRETGGAPDTGRKPGEGKIFRREVGGGQHGNVEEARMMQEEGMHPDDDKPQSSTRPA